MMLLLVQEIWDHQGQVRIFLRGLIYDRIKKELKMIGDGVQWNSWVWKGGVWGQGENRYGELKKVP